MSDKYRKFLKDSERVGFDLEHRQVINNNISKYDIALEKGKEQFANLDLARMRAANIRYKSINNMDKLLIEFEVNFENNGGKVIWAQNKKEAIKEIQEIVKRSNASTIVKSKSMITEEIDLNEMLVKKKVDVVETDLGEFIVQLAGEKPYHIITPAMHKSKEDVSKLFNQKFGIPETSSPNEITEFTRKELRQKFFKADIGITGANFIVADSGSICLTENEGNALMSVSSPRIHISIVGIEKVIPSFSDLQLFWPLLATFGTGQKITAYNHIISGPRQDNESDGPEEMYVVLIDNNRTDVLKKERQRRALSCIRCGACLNVCPVYKNIGGYSYGTVYSGPIGSVITPYMKGIRDYKHLSYASSLCGSCTEVCPVKIPLHELLLVNRNDFVKQGLITGKESLTMRRMKKSVMRRKTMNFGSNALKNRALKIFFKKPWGPRRELPVFREKSFNKQWKEKHKPSGKK